MVARLGGDEFVVVLTDVGGSLRRGAAHRRPDPRRRCAEPFAVDGTPVGLGGAIGVASYPEDAHDVSSVLAHADRAMYMDKGARNGSLR